MKKKQKNLSFKKNNSKSSLNNNFVSKKTNLLKRNLSGRIIIIILSLIIISGFIYSFNYFKNPNKLLNNKLLVKREISDLNNNKLILDNGDVIELPVNIEEAFSSSESLLNTLKDKGLNLSSRKEVEEYADRLVITSEVVSESNPGFLGWSDNETSEEENESINDSSYNNSFLPKEILDDAASNFLDKCGNNHSPLCKLSKEKLIDLLKVDSEDSNNSINLNLSDQFFYQEVFVIGKIPKNSLNDIFKEKELLKDPLKIKVPAFLLEKKPILEGGDFYYDDNKENISFITTLKEPLITTSPLNYNAIFIDGFTKNYDFFYSKKWVWKKYKQTIFSLKLSSYNGIGFGMRAPFELRVTMPSILDKEQEEFNTTITIKPRDLSKTEMKNAGIPTNELFDGKELVLKIMNELGISVTLFGSKIIDYTLRRGLDNSKDLVPPVNNDYIKLDELLRGNQFDFFYQNKGLFLNPELGLHVEISGRNLYLDMNPVNVEKEPNTLTFHKTNEMTFSSKVKAIGDKNDSLGRYNNFGFEFNTLRYQTSLDVVYELRLLSNFSISHIGTKSFNTPWIRFKVLSIPMFLLFPHDSTTISLKATDSRKYVNPLSLTFNQTLIPFDQGCNSLKNIIKENSSLEKPSNAMINIIVDNEPIGVVIIKNNRVEKVICGLLSNSADYIVNINSFEELNNFDYLINKKKNAFYNVLLDNLENKNISIKGKSLLENIFINNLPKLNKIMN